MVKKNDKGIEHRLSQRWKRENDKGIERTLLFFRSTNCLNSGKEKIIGNRKNTCVFQEHRLSQRWKRENDSGIEKHSCFSGAPYILRGQEIFSINRIQAIQGYAKHMRPCHYLAAKKGNAKL
ncbi:hypothetical protein CEXT_486481 [Caerostris extrusa]|uniref:Uncharacterized protein n=1 Tax=Caerostris extrusa TaxID=172846 RepID=A0AAV4SSB1_CAEEX|nr:hypothetical protein CEXT_486481 [Caerostris extrusa]